MGNCGAIFCNREQSHNNVTNSNKIITDIVLDHKINKESLNQIYSQMPLLDKVVFLQVKIKYFLKTQKSKMRKQNKDTNSKANRTKKKNDQKINNNSTTEDLKNNKKEKIIIDNTTNY